MTCDRRRAILFSILAVATIAIGQTDYSAPAFAGQKFPFEHLSSKLSADFPAASIQSKEYLNARFIFDQKIQRSPFEVAAPNPLRPEFGHHGLPVQDRHLLVQFKPDAAPAQIISLLEKFRLKIRNSILDVGVFVLELEEGTHFPIGERSVPTEARIAILNQTCRTLKSEPIVRSAALNLLLGPMIITASSLTPGRDDRGDLQHWNWGPGPGPDAIQSDGNYGQKMARFPAAWNFSAAIRARGNTSVPVGILDSGFSPHEDLDFSALSGLPPRVTDHGNQVAGIIGAKFNNALGINGVTPFARLIVGTPASVARVDDSAIPKDYVIFSDVIASLVEFLKNTGGIKVINVGFGYNWFLTYAKDPSADPEIWELVRSQGLMMRSVADLAAHRGVILVSPAGNDTSRSASRGVDSQWGSPLNWAALNDDGSGAPARNVIVVESIGRSGARSTFSNVRGCVSAPGEKILSTVTYDQFGRISPSSYGAFSGTSMAAPQVTGLVALMYAYNPKLTVEQVLDILGVRTTNRPATTNPAPPIDAFAALLECRPEALRDLADLSGDGRVDMADFIKFKAALHQVEGTPIGPLEDLNGDGVLTPTGPNDPGENVWPRADLNGSGRLSRDSADRRILKGELFSDLEVMMKVWQDTTVPPAALPAML
jgi:subtilisin family serine protease